MNPDQRKYGNSPRVFKNTSSPPKEKRDLNQTSVMSIKSPAAVEMDDAQYNQVEDKLMREIMENYRVAMNMGKG